MEATTNGNADLWRDRIAAQRAGGQSIRAWCKANRCHEHSFYWWRARLGLSPGRRRRRAVKRLAFTEVVIDQPAAESIRLILSGSRELHLPPSMPVESLAKLIRAIEGAA